MIDKFSKYQINSKIILFKYLTDFLFNYCRFFHSINTKFFEILREKLEFIWLKLEKAVCICILSLVGLLKLLAQLNPKLISKKNVRNSLKNQLFAINLGLSFKARIVFFSTCKIK